jgi:small subunit ribosomal protein S14
MATISAMAKMRKHLKYATKYRNRCRLCGRPRAYIRDFGLCRICFRKLAHKGEIPGVTKSSW